MDNKDFAEKLERRTRMFAVDVMRLSACLPNTPENMVIRHQLTKSGTSVGAKYREANRSRSKADFKNKIRICESEASETSYWLRIIDEMKWLPSDKVIPTYNEGNEMLALFTSIAKGL
jgi:four helix bundle protein